MLMNSSSLPPPRLTLLPRALSLLHFFSLHFLSYSFLSAISYEESQTRDIAVFPPFHSKDEDDDDGPPLW